MAYRPLIQTKADLKQYILAKLGAPVIEIEITDEQLDYAIEDVLEYYMQRAYSGQLERYIPITLLAGVQNYILPYEIFSVVGIQSVGIGGLSNSAPGNMFSINQFVASDLYRGSGKIDLLTYELTNNMLATLEMVLSKKLTFDFNSISRVISLFEVPRADEQVVLHVFKRNVPTYTPNPLFGSVPDQPEEFEDTNIYNELMIKKLSCEYARRQWGYNLVKYDGTTLPNGLTLNPTRIIDEANTNILKLEEEFENSMVMPTDFFLG